MGHDHDEHHDAKAEEEAVKPKDYWHITPGRRARPQYDAAEVARAYLDEMERGGRLHLKRKRT